MQLQKWINEQTVSDDMLWKGAFGHQVAFIRDNIARFVTSEFRIDDAEKLVTVVSTHRSKSITLPVVEINNPNIGLTLILRNNFSNWKLSVISAEPIVAPFEYMFHTTPPVEPDYTGDPLHPVYFEGFPRDLIFSYYSKNNRKFSAEIHGDEMLFMTVFEILKSLGKLQPMKWLTRVEHKAQMDKNFNEWKARFEAEKAATEMKA